MFLTSRWFPLVFALLQTARYFGLIGYDYWAAAQNERRSDVAAFVRMDLARPMFEPYGFCGAWTSYSFGQSAALGTDYPAFMAAMLLQASISRKATCIDTLATPRGQILTSLFVLPIWFLVGLSARRIALRRWRRPVARPIARAILRLGWVLLPLGSLLLLMSVTSLFFSGAELSIRLAGLAFWMVYWGSLAAESLGVWPFEWVDRMTERLRQSGAPREARADGGR